MYRQTGPSKGNRRAPVAAPGRSRPTAQRGGGGNKAAGSPVPTAASSTVATISPSGAVSGPSPAAVRAAKASRRRVARAKRQASKEERQKRAAVLAQVSADRRTRAKSRLASTATISSRDSSKPAEFRGRKTAGTPTKSELQEAAKADLLKVNKAGALTTPAVRQASRRLTKAQEAARTSMPDVSGLSPAERRILPFARRAHREYPDIPVSVLMAQDKQESGFDPLAESSAGAFGASQFIPSTAASYGVRRGNSRKAIQSQISGQAHLLHDDNFATDPQGALSAYSGGYAASDYNNPILADAKANYSGLDKAGSPKARKQLAAAKKAAKELGLKPKTSRGGEPSPQTIKVRALARKVASLPIVRQNKAGTIKLAGGSVVLTDTSDGPAEVRKGMEPQITARLLMLSAKVGRPVYVISGARTPQHSVEVGGFPDDPHTKGEAQDIGVGAPTLASAAAIPESTYESVGLYRPFGTARGGSSAEDNHVQIMPGAAGSVTVAPGVGAAAPSGGAPVSGAIPPGAITAYAKQTGQTPAQVRRKLKGKNGARLLTVLQHYNRAKRKLRAVGAPLSSSSKSRRPESHPILEELKAKYGSAPTSAKQRAAEAAKA